jgi:hypothetical protein
MSNTPRQNLNTLEQRSVINTTGDSRVNSPGFSSGTIVIPLSTQPDTPAISPGRQVFDNLNDTQGRRVRLRAKPAAASRVYGTNGLMQPLYSTKGMLFPYQPIITYAQDVVYDVMQLVHSNQDIYAYSRTPSLKLVVDGDFTVQNQSEGLYALACIHFLRTVTKMWFGGTGTDAEENQGTPPPVLLFDAYGQYMFNELPVIVTQFTVSLPNDVDYVPVKFSPSSLGETRTVQSINSRNLQSNSSDGYAWLPAMFKIGVQLSVQNTPQKLRQFNMTEFTNGSLLTRGGWV